MLLVRLMVAPQGGADEMMMVMKCARHIAEREREGMTADDNDA